MDNDTVIIDLDALRKDMLNEAYGAFFGGGFGAALIEAGNIEKASSRELFEIAERMGINLIDYRVQ